MAPIDFQVIDWSKIPVTEQPGETGSTTIRTLQLNGLRIRRVDYSPGYLADHWCRKGHIVHCLEGQLVSQMEEGGAVCLEKGMTYVVSNEQSSHRSFSEKGVSLLIIDGDFLAGSF